MQHLQPVGGLTTGAGGAGGAGGFQPRFQLLLGDSDVPKLHIIHIIVLLRLSTPTDRQQTNNRLTTDSNPTWSKLKTKAVLDSVLKLEARFSLRLVDST